MHSTVVTALLAKPKKTRVDLMTFLTLSYYACMQTLYFIGMAGLLIVAGLGTC